MVADPKEQSTIFSNFFSSVFTRSSTELPTLERHDDTPVINEIYISEERISQCIDDLKEGTAAGPDGMAPKVIKMLKAELLRPFRILFEKSMETGKIPDAWREAHITAIYKNKGKRCDPGNYRGVSLTCVAGKILEKIVKSDINGHIERNDLLLNSQHGFRTGRSCQTNLIEFLGQMTKWMDEGKNFDVIYLDFAKAFDKVCHRRLIIKLKHIGIDGKLLQWIVDWLSGRKQKVVIDGESSDWVDVISSVLQGSVLGAILFNIYVKCKTKHN